MFRHIIALSILLMSLLAAGVPALACVEVVSTCDCCRNGPNSPCGSEQSRTTEADRLDLCCAAGSTVTTTTAIATSSNELRKAWDRGDLPALLILVTTLTTAYVQSPSVDEFSLVSRPLSDSTLYLSTGRLRL
jgi:hypothetical protein